VHLTKWNDSKIFVLIEVVKLQTNEHYLKNGYNILEMSNRSPFTDSSNFLKSIREWWDFVNQNEFFVFRFLLVKNVTRRFFASDFTIGNNVMIHWYWILLSPKKNLLVLNNLTSLHVKSNKESIELTILLESM